MADFLNMGGYAFFVWTSYAVVVVLLIWHFISPLLRTRSILKSIHTRYRDEMDPVDIRHDSQT